MKNYIIALILMCIVNESYSQKGCFNIRSVGNSLTVSFVATEPISATGFAEVTQGAFRLRWSENFGTNALTGSSNSGNSIPFSATDGLTPGAPSGGFYSKEFTFQDQTGVEVNLAVGESINLVTLNTDRGGQGGSFRISGVNLSSQFGINYYQNTPDCTIEIIFNVLPVELTYFTAQAQSDNTSLLNWETSAEINNDYFSVQHSVNGLDFDEIGTVEGNGTTNEIKQYEFVHTNPVRGTNYYRLTQMDFDGEFEKSPIRSVEFDGVPNTKFKVFPNPSNSYLMIIPPDTSQKTWNVDIYDTAGKRIKSFLIRDNFYHLNTTELANGVYHLQVNSGTQSDQLRFVKH